uniref:protein-glutamine gamma-glutamyltransferase n=1 Tax=Leptobrachium leishanense TaxID=445787 RepID=A0A8C5R6I2_9ANUR
MSSLLLTNWDLQRSVNAPLHKTKDYATNQLVVRRGQSFSVSCTFNRDLKPEETLTFISDIGSSPSEAKNTRAVMPVSSTESKTPWSATSASSSGTTRIFSINSSVTAIIGRYQLSLRVTSGGLTSTKNLGEFCLLFNPWAQDDEVFMEDEPERGEYVLNEMGVIFVGSYNSFSQRLWNYGQFQEKILDITLSLLDKSTDAKKDPAADLSKRNGAVYVGRVLSAMVNSNNDRGVVLGNWSGNYSNGVNPSQWNGSVAILRSWQLRGPVSYGQCWVYAGVLCTVLRCLGIPSRVITNFESAHDTNKNLLIDHYFDEGGNQLESSDSVWNFHVWNEGWLKRKDLGTSYGGWQVLDATPQEPSAGIFRLGPCSLAAVKEGDVNLEYDAYFVFAEVNGDIVNWMKSEDGSYARIYSDQKAVGKLISTKAVGSQNRVDVTDNYKYAEDSNEEREIFEKARRKLANMTTSSISMNPASGPARVSAPESEDPEPPAPIPDFTGHWTVPEDLQVGDGIRFILYLKNGTAESKQVKANMTVTSIIYTREIVKEITKKAESVHLQPNEEVHIPLVVYYNDYKDAITTDHMVQAVALCMDEKGDRLLTRIVATLNNIPLDIKISEKPVVNRPLIVDIVISNPLAEDIEHGHLVMEGNGFVKPSFSRTYAYFQRFLL